MTAPDFEAFQSALTRKLEREVFGVPVPGVAALLGIGLIGVVMFQRRRIV